MSIANEIIGVVLGVTGIALAAFIAMVVLDIRRDKKVLDQQRALHDEWKRIYEPGEDENLGDA